MDLLDEMLIAEWMAYNSPCGCDQDPTAQVSNRCPNPEPLPEDRAAAIAALAGDELLRLKYLVFIEERIALTVDLAIREACSTHRTAAVARAVGISWNAINKRRQRGWIRKGYIGQPRSRKPKEAA
jgi:hypothetical protein